MSDNRASEMVERLNKLIERQRHQRGDMMFYGRPDQELVDAAREIASLSERLKAAEETLAAAHGYLLNAKIDLETGAPKRTALATLNRGLLRVRRATEGEKGEHVTDTK